MLWESGILLSLLRIIRLSAKLEPVVQALGGPAGFFWFRGGTVSHRLASIGSDDVTTLGVDVGLRIGVSAAVAVVV